MSSASFTRIAASAFNSSAAKRFAFAGAAAAAATAAATMYGNNRKNNQMNGSGHNFGSKAFLFGLFGTPEYAKNTREGQSDVKPKEYYQKVYNDIALKIRDHTEWDNGSYGPILVRFAWHNSGTYNQHDHSITKGGSYPATMRYEKEQKDPENAGLMSAKKFLESIGEKYPELSHGDLWTLGGVAAVQEMEGPKIPWRPGRKDQGEECIPPYHRLPDAHQTTGDYVRSVFHDRLGFTDKEMVCLIGVGHAIGECHRHSSGFDGPWTFSPTMITNEFYKLLLDGDWEFKKWDGPKQYTDVKTKSLMMLPTDMTLKTDPTFRKYAREYADDSDKCMKDFSSAFSRLLERGITFPKGTPKMVFQTLDEQGIEDED